MKFPKISAAVPEGEHFDESAVNEGVWLSEKHLNSIENVLSVSEKNISETAASLETANASIVTLTEELSVEKGNVSRLTAEKETAEQKIIDQAAAHTSVIGAKDAEIASLQAEVAKLGKNASGTGSAVVATADENPKETGEKAGLLDPEHPLNQYAATKLASAKKPKL